MKKNTPINEKNTITTNTNTIQYNSKEQTKILSPTTKQGHMFSLQIYPINHLCAQYSLKAISGTNSDFRPGLIRTNKYIWIISDEHIHNSRYHFFTTIMTIFDDSIPVEENVIRRGHLSETLVRHITGTFMNTMEEWFSKNSEQLRISRIVPERPNFFHSQFPRKSSNLDSEYHYSHFDAGMLARFFPELVLRIIVPALYLEDMKRDKLHLMTKGVPTMEELAKCQSLEGMGFWNRSGTWFCTRGYDQIKLRLSDEFGPHYFKSYNEWLNWDSKIAQDITDAKEHENWEMVKKLRGLSG